VRRHLRSAVQGADRRLLQVLEGQCVPDVPDVPDVPAVVAWSQSSTAGAQAASRLKTKYAATDLRQRCLLL
jgi:hypothetical protein